MKRLTSLLIFMFVFASTGELMAWAKKAGFDGAGNYYTGSTRAGSETCKTCHTGTPTGDKFNVNPVDMPYSSLSGVYVYLAGKTYTIDVSMISDLGGGAGNLNQNGFTMEILDSNNQPAGTLTPVTQTQLSDSPSQVILDDDIPNADNTSSINTSWSFTWTAPDVTNGGLSVYFAGVDGDGDGVDSNADLTDALVFVLMEQSLVPAESGGCSLNASTKPIPSGLTLLAILILLGLGLKSCKPSRISS